MAELKKKRKSKHYATNQELEVEIAKSKKQGKLTERAGTLLLSIVQGLQRLYWYESDELREDICYGAFIIILENWHKADLENPSRNLFGWFTTVAHNGLKASMNDHTKRTLAEYSYSTLFEENI